MKKSLNNFITQKIFRHISFKFFLSFKTAGFKSFQNIFQSFYKRNSFREAKVVVFIVSDPDYENTFAVLRNSVMLRVQYLIINVVRYAVLVRENNRVPIDRFSCQIVNPPLESFPAVI